MTFGLLIISLIVAVIGILVAMIGCAVDGVKREVESLKFEQRETNRLLTQIRDFGWRSK